MTENAQKTMLGRLNAPLASAPQRQFIKTTLVNFSTPNLTPPSDVVLHGHQHSPTLPPLDCDLSQITHRQGSYSPTLEPVSSYGLFFKISFHLLLYSLLFLSFLCHSIFVFVIQLIRLISLSHSC